MHKYLPAKSIICVMTVPCQKRPCGSVNIRRIYCKTNG